MDIPKCEIQLNDIQGHVIRGAKVAASKFYFLVITEPKAFADFLKSEGFLKYLASEQKIRERSGAFLNIAFSFSGLEALGLPGKLLGQFPPAFREGMANRSEFIGDFGSDGPTNWQGYFGTAYIHAMIAVHWIPDSRSDCWSEEQCQQHWHAIDDVWRFLVDPISGAPAGSHCLAMEQAHVIREGGKIKEHFGFTDGISQPYVNDGVTCRSGGGKKTERNGEWQPLAAGEFLLGYCDELQLNHKRTANNEIVPDTLIPRDMENPLDAAFFELTLNGSYMVYRKLEQDVAGFRKACGDGEHGSLAEKMVGRRYDGTPLSFPEYGDKYNEFDYGDEEQKSRCPFTSHVRRANPRLSLAEGPEDGTQLVDQHRIIRRGISYGNYIPMNSNTDSHQNMNESSRGIHFICYNARIDSQFEFIQKHWLNSSDFMASASPVVDPICGNRHQDPLGMFAARADEEPVFGLQQYVHVKGGEYFFTPGLHGVALIARLTNAIDPLLRDRNNIELFDSLNSDPLQIEKHIDPAQLLTGKGYVKFEIEDDRGHSRPYYYFAKPEDLDAILNAPDLFTNDHYRSSIMALTGRDMLLSRPVTKEREALKKHLGVLMNPAGFSDLMQATLESELTEISRQLQENQSIDLVEGIARRLPLAVIKNFFGVDNLGFSGEPYSPTEVAFHFGCTDFARLPSRWKHNPKAFGFVSDQDKTLLFWIRALFLEVFSNQYKIKFIQELAANASRELIQKMDQFIAGKMQEAATSPSLLTQLLALFQTEYGYQGEALVKAVRQSLLEFMVGSTDTAAKGIAEVIRTILTFGIDMQSGLFNLLKDDEPSKYVLKKWLEGDDSPESQAMVDAVLNGIIITCLRINPVAPLIPRYCTHGGRFVTSGHEVLDIEPGAVVILVTKVTLGASLMYKLPVEQERFLFTENSPHACMGRQIAMFEIRAAIKVLLKFKAVRPAAGPSGQYREKYRLPERMILRCGT